MDPDRARRVRDRRQSDEEIASTANLDARLGEALQTLSEQDPDAGRAQYEQGVPNSSVICLGAIPVTDEARAIR